MQTDTSTSRLLKNWRKRKLKTVQENAEAPIPWDMLIQTDPKLQETWPDIKIKTTEKRSYVVNDVAMPLENYKNGGHN